MDNKNNPSLKININKGYNKEILQGKKPLEPTPRSIFRKSILDNKYELIPVDILKEILTWDEIYCRRVGTTFFNKQKDWGLTIPDTIRISDHWNFTSQKTFFRKIHSVTDIEVPEGVFCKGIYDFVKNHYRILEIYNTPPNQKDLYTEYRRELLSEQTMSNDKKELCKELGQKSKAGLVTFKSEHLEGKVTKFKFPPLSIYVSIEEDQQPIPTDIDFSLVFDDGRVITKQELLQKLVNPIF